MLVIKISGAGVHTGKDSNIEVKEYPKELGFVGSLAAFCQEFPQATQISLIRGESDDD